jgi:uncharacterized membrane protein YukC
MFDKLPTFWKVLIVIGSLTLLLVVLLLIVILYMFCEQNNEQEVDVSEHNDFLKEFMDEAIHSDDHVTTIKELDGKNNVRNLLSIEIVR